MLGPITKIIRRAGLLDQDWFTQEITVEPIQVSDITSSALDHFDRLFREAYPTSVPIELNSSTLEGYTLYLNYDVDLENIREPQPLEYALCDRV